MLRPPWRAPGSRSKALVSLIAGGGPHCDLISEAVPLPIGRLAIGLPQHPDQHRPQRPVLLAVDQEWATRVTHPRDEGSPRYQGIET